MDDEKKKKSKTQSHSHSHHRKKRKTKSKISVTKTKSRVSKQRASSRVRPKERETLAKLLSQNSVDDVVQCFPFALTFCGCGRECGRKNVKIKKISSSKPGKSSRKKRISVHKESKVNNQEESKTVGAEEIHDKSDKEIIVEQAPIKEVPEEAVSLDQLKLNGNIKNVMSNVKFSSLFTRPNVPKTISQVKLLLASNPNLKAQIKTILGDNINNENMKAVSNLLASDEDDQETKPINIEEKNESINERCNSAENNCDQNKDNVNITSKCSQSSTNLKSSPKRKERDDGNINSQTSLFSRIVSAIFGPKEMKDEKRVPRKHLKKSRYDDGDYSFTDAKTKELREKYDEWYKKSSPRMRERFQWDDFVRVTKYLNNINKEPLSYDNKKTNVMLKQWLTNFSDELSNRLSNKSSQESQNECHQQNREGDCQDKNDHLIKGKTLQELSCYKEKDDGGTTTVEDLNEISCPQFIDVSFDTSRSTMQSHRVNPLDTNITNPDERQFVGRYPESNSYLQSSIDPDASKNILQRATEMLCNDKSLNRSRVIISESALYPDNFLDGKSPSFLEGNEINQINYLESQCKNTYSDINKLSPLIPTVQFNSELPPASRIHIKRIKSEEMLNSCSGDVINRLNSLIKELTTNEANTFERNSRRCSSKLNEQSSIIFNNKGMSSELVNTSDNTALRSSSTKMAEDVSLCQMMCASFVEKLTKHESKEGAKFALRTQPSRLAHPWGRNDFQIYTLPAFETQNPFTENKASLQESTPNDKGGVVESSEKQEDLNVLDKEIKTNTIQSIINKENSEENILHECAEQKKEWLGKKVSFNDKPSWLSYSVESQNTESSCNLNSNNNFNDTDETEELEIKSRETGRGKVINQLNTLIKQLQNKELNSYGTANYNYSTCNSEIIDSPEVPSIDHSLAECSSVSQIRCSSYVNLMKKGNQMPWSNKNFQVYCMPTIETDNPFQENLIEEDFILEEENSQTNSEKSDKSKLEFDSPLSTSEKNTGSHESNVNWCNNCNEATRQNIKYIPPKTKTSNVCTNKESLKHDDYSELATKRNDEDYLNHIKELKLNKKPLGQYLLEQHIQNTFNVPSRDQTALATVTSTSDTDFTNITSGISLYEDKDFTYDEFSEIQRDEFKKVIKYLIRTANNHPYLFQSMGDLENENISKYKKNSCIGIQCKLSEEKLISVNPSIQYFKEFPHKLQKSVSEIVTKRESCEVQSLFSEDKFILRSDSGFNSKSFGSMERKQFISLPDVLEGASSMVANEISSTGSSKDCYDKKDCLSSNLTDSCPSTSMSCQASHSADVDISQSSNCELINLNNLKKIEINKITNKCEAGSSSENMSNSDIEHSSKSRIKRILKKIRMKDRKNKS